MNAIIETARGWFDLLGPNRWVQAGAIVVLSVIAARTVDWLIRRTLKIWASRTQTDFDDRLFGHLHRPVFLSILFIGLTAAANRLGMADTPLWVTTGVLKTILVWVWLVCGVRAASLIIETLGRHRERFPLVQPSTAPLLETVSRLVLVGGAIYFVLLCWNVDPTAWLASAGIIGLALSFAAKDSLANLFAGVFILADAPYRVGDFVNLDSGERGVVTRIGMRSTRMLTRDDVEITIPNAIMGNAKIVNESGGPYEKERIRVPVGVAYGSDIDQVEAMLMRIARTHEEIVEDPEPRVRFRSFGNSALELELLVWIEQPLDRGRLTHLLNCEIYRGCAEEGIEIPFPKRDVYVRQMPGQTT